MKGLRIRAGGYTVHLSVRGQFVALLVVGVLAYLLFSKATQQFHCTGESFHLASGRTSCVYIHPSNPPTDAFHPTHLHIPGGRSH